MKRLRAVTVAAMALGLVGISGLVDWRPMPAGSEVPDLVQILNVCNASRDGLIVNGYECKHVPGEGWQWVKIS